MINVPIKHYEHSEDEKKYIISVFQFHVRTEYSDNDNVDEVKRFNVERITKMLETAEQVDNEAGTID